MTFGTRADHLREVDMLGIFRFDQLRTCTQDYLQLNTEEVRIRLFDAALMHH